MKAYKQGKFALGVLAGAVTTVVLMIAGLGVLILMFLFGGERTESRDISMYEKLSDYYIHSGFMVFPETIPESAENVDFYFYHWDSFNSPTCEVYLQCDYSKEDYEAELKRLENTSKSYGKQKKALRKEDGQFHYPAYVAVYNHFDEYEYALLTGENQITYVHTAYRAKEDVSFDDKYFHIDNGENVKKSELYGYSIYLLWAEDGCMDYDYTRQEVVPVTKTHGEQTADKHSYFYVNTEVKEDDKEYITNCEYYYWENMRDSEPDITTYPDLQGYEYVSFQLNEEKTKAQVIYRNQKGEECKWTKDIPEK
ncbi:MAG: hypothetical protein IJF03_02410 [Lachnospiraceae bacterium]|nr:hypothetical protein [Lachnospiraceae bacterium]